MREKLSIYSKGKLYYSLINNFIPETIAKILSKHNITNLLDNSTEIEVFNKKYSTNNLNFILSSFKNSLKYLDFSKNIEFEKRLRDIFVDLELALIKLQFMQKTKSLLSIIVNKLEYFFETIKNEIEYVQRKIKNINKTLKLNNYYKNNIDYINNEFVNVENEIEEINKMNNNSKIDASILNKTKNVLILISNILYENEKRAAVIVGISGNGDAIKDVIVVDLELKDGEWRANEIASFVFVNIVLASSEE